MSVHYVPAGVEAWTQAPAQLLIKNAPNKKEQTFFGQYYRRWESFDKTVVQVLTALRGQVLPAETFDITIPIFCPSFAKVCGLTKVLGNPTQKWYDRRAFAVQGIESIVDSGGFQMLSEKIDFVSPDVVIERYNRNADVGMPLDVPMGVALEDRYFNAVSHLIRANDKYMLPRLKPRVQLALISHGTTLERRKARLDVLDREAKVVAIAGLHIQPAPGIDRTLSALENFMYVVSRYHKRTEYFHVLGVTSKLWLFLYSLLSANGYVNSIGADSVSHRIMALSGSFDTADFGSVALNKDLVYKTIPKCGCPVCFSVGDLRIIQNWRLLETHNLWVRAQQTKLLEEIGIRYIAGSVKLKEIHSLLGLGMDLNRFTVIVSYVMETMANKFKPMNVQGRTKNLFGANSKTGSQGNPHYEKILASYEKFHKTKFPR